MNDFEKHLAGQPLKKIPSEWRSEILGAAESRSQRIAGLSTRSASDDTGPLPVGRPALRLRQWFHELLWPCPQAWAALAAVWIVIVVVQFATPSGAPSSGAQIANATVISVAELRRELAELLGPATETRERSPADRPRSARTLNYAFA